MPFCVKGRLPPRCDVDPLELTRAIDGAERCEKVLARCWGISIRSEEGCLAIDGVPLLEKLRGMLLRRCCCGCLCIRPCCEEFEGEVLSGNDRIAVISAWSCSSCSCLSRSSACFARRSCSRPSSKDVSIIRLEDMLDKYLGIR